MNIDQQPDVGASSEPLPELSDERINRIETSLFTEIARDRTVHRKRRTGVWVATSAAAAVIVVAAVIAPSVGGLLTGTASNDAAVGPAAPLVDSGAGSESDSSGGVAPDPNAVKERVSSPPTRRARRIPSRVRMSAKPPATSSRPRQPPSWSATSRPPPR